MNCLICQERLEEFLEERMDEASRDAFRFHSEHCESCRAMVEDAVFGRSVVSTAFPDEEWKASPQFFSRFWLSIERERAKPFSWVAVRDLAFRFVVGAALIVVFLVALAAVRNPRPAENQLAIENYLEAPGAPDAFREVLIGDVNTNRDQLLNNLLERDRQQNSMPVHPAAPPPTPNK